MPHQILYPSSRCGPSAKHYLIFFITGNPGFIAYYNTFLATLNHLLSPLLSSSDPRIATFDIFGQSLPGFEDDDDPTATHSGPYGLQETIDHTFDLLVTQRISTGDRKGEPFDGIILIGHSVGAYILLELLRKTRQKSFSETIKVKAGILLFATIMDLAQSSNGIRFGILFRIPDFPKVFSMLVKGIFWPWPRAAVKWLVGFVTRMPDDAADVTTRLLIGKRALWQALHMAKDEMLMISGDKWDEDVWGVERPDPDSKDAVPKLIFYFGQKDEWVADHTRDSLIALRGGVDGQNMRKPKMMIDQSGIPHAFCIKHGELIAEKVKVWIDEIVRAD